MFGVPLEMIGAPISQLQQKDAWKTELKEFSSKNGYDLNRNGDSGPLLLDVLEGFLKFEVWHLPLSAELFLPFLFQLIIRNLN